MTNEIVPYLPVFTAIGVAIISGGYAIWRLKFSHREPLPPTWPQMWDRMDKIEAKQRSQSTAFANILRTLYDQWPVGTPKPIFNKDDLMMLDEDTLPAQWR